MTWPRVRLSTDVAVGRIAAAATLGVAGIAAVVSYGHIEALALHHAQPIWFARLMPISVDGVVVAASMHLVKAARAGKSDVVAVGWLAAAIAATVAANVAYGWPHGWLAAMVSGWPAVAFIGTAEMAIRTLRKTAKKPATSSASGRVKPARKPSGSAAKRRAAERLLAAADGPLSGAELARQVGVPERTARRWAASGRHHAA